MNDYMLLGRYKADLDYYFGYGGKCAKHLYFGEINKHMRETINLWKSLPKKPEWFRAVDLINYKRLIKQ